MPRCQKIVSGIVCVYKRNSRSGVVHKRAYPNWPDGYEASDDSQSWQVIGVRREGRHKSKTNI